jgi:hypothetical protein
VQLLNDEEKHQTQRQVVARHADQLDDILIQIQQIEQDELLLLAQQTVSPFATHDNANVSGWKGRHSSSGMVLDRKLVVDEDAATGSSASNLVLPLEVLMNVKIQDEDEQVERTHHDHVTSGAFDPLSTPARALPKEMGILSTLPAIRTNVLQGKRLQSIEKRRTEFLKHRRLVEAALSDTGMAQSAVIEMCVLYLFMFLFASLSDPLGMHSCHDFSLEELMVMDIIEEAAVELEDTVGTISETVVTNLL